MPTKPKAVYADVKALNARRQEEVRAHIQADAIVRRLSGIHMGEVRGEPALLAVQVRAGLGLLAKALPDLQSVSLSGEEGGPLQIVVRTLAGPK